MPDEVVTPPPLPRYLKKYMLKINSLLCNFLFSFLVFILLFLISRSAYVIQQQVQLASKKYDLSKWKYSDLRDAINTSCGNIFFLKFILIFFSVIM